MPLQIDVTQDGYRLAGELDMATADDLLAVLRERRGEGRVTLDCASLTFMDSSGLRALLEAARDGGEDVLVILDPSPQVRRVLDISLPDGAPGLEVRGGEEEGS